MTTLHFTQTTTVTPEQFLTALTDFGPGRSQLFPNSHDDQLVVHDLGSDHADVTEGGGGAWERLDYDWSDPHKIVMTTTDSNAWGGNSGHTYVLTPLADGGTRVDATVVREGKNAKGRFFEAIFKAFGNKILGGAFEKTVRAIEVRTNKESSPTA